MDMSGVQKKLTGWLGKYKYVVLIVLAGICLMLIPNGKQEEQQITEQVSVVPQQTVGDELTEILSNIKGAGKVKVMLTVKTGERYTYQTDQPSENRQDTVIVTDKDRGQNGLIQQVESPIYRGAIVLCQGADSAGVRLAIVDAVSKVTGLDASEISVLKMK